MVDNDRAITDATQHTVVAEENGADIVVISNTAKDYFSIQCRSGRRLCTGSSVLIDPGISFRGSSIENRELMPCTDKVSGHRITHDPKADECDSHFVDSPVLLACRSSP